jgi:hypothetical protein
MVYEKKGDEKVSTKARKSKSQKKEEKLGEKDL